MIKKLFQDDYNFTMVDNVVFDHLMAVCDPGVFKLVMFIIRKTVGYHKSADRISLSQFADATNMAMSTIGENMQKALEMGLIIRTAVGNSYLYSLNSDYEIEIQEPESDHYTPTYPSITTPISGKTPPNLPESGKKTYRNPVIQNKERNSDLRSAKGQNAAAHPALQTYRSVIRLQVPVALRQEVISTVGTSQESLTLWRKILYDWLSLGWNKQNIKGMLESFVRGEVRQSKPAPPPRPFLENIPVLEQYDYTNIKE